MPVRHYGIDSATRGYKKFHEGTALLNVHAGAGYKAQQNMNEVQGVINLNLGEEQKLPPLVEAQIDNHIMGVVFAQQYTLEKGTEKFGDRAEEATTKELKQIHDMGTYQPLDATKITKKERMEALSSLLFITERRDGRIKSRKCAIGSKQQKFEGYDKAAGSSPPLYPPMA